MVQVAKFRRWLSGALLVMALAPGWSAAKGPHPVQGLEAESAVVNVSELPKQGQQTYALIFDGGPFPYDKDGSVFGNRERLLPQQKRGYWREYTVRTPSERTRGARRIVCGGPKRSPDVCFYTADHYSSFRKIVK